jgi:hypothetical protein
MITKALEYIFRKENSKYRPRVAIQTGLKDLELLKIIYKRARRGKFPVYAVDSNYSVYNKARLLYQNRNIVRCRYGYSVDINKATDYLKQDEAYLRPEQYPAISIDGSILYYLNEFRGDVEQHSTVRFYTDNLFRDVIPKIKKKNPLFILTSPIGFFEFRTMVEMMGKRRYYLLIKNIGHITHFRTYGCVIAYPGSWRIIAEELNDWVLVQHMGANRIKNLKGDLCE